MLFSLIIVKSSWKRRSICSSSCSWWRNKFTLGTAQNSLDKKETLTHLREWNERNNCIPRAIVGDEAFFSDDFNEFYKFHGIKGLPCGPRTPWPNRAETAGRLFKKQWTRMATSLEGDDRFNGFTIQQAVKMTVWARNTQLTISGFSPLEIATDLLICLMLKQQVQNGWLQNHLKKMYQHWHYKDLLWEHIRKPDKQLIWDMTWQEGQCHLMGLIDKVMKCLTGIKTSVSSRIKRIRGKVVSQEGAMVHIHTDKAVIRVNQSKVGRDHDEWHDVSIPNLDEAKEEIKDEGELKREDHNLLCEGCLGEQAFWFYDISCLAAAPAIVGWWHGKESRLDSQLMTNMDLYNLNTAYGQAEAWKKIVKMDPETIFINNPSSHSARKMIFRFCLDVIIWQCKKQEIHCDMSWRTLHLTMFRPEEMPKVLSKHLRWERVDLQHFCNCEDEIRSMLV